MKVRCDRAGLADRLGAMGGIISPSSPKPILGDFLLSTEEGHLVAEATDLSLTGRVHAHKVEVSEEGQLALPSAHLLSILKEIPEDFLQIDSLSDSHGAEISSSGFRFKILGHDPTEFPRLAPTAEVPRAVVGRTKLSESLKRVGVATSRDATRYQLNGVFIEIEKGQISLTATDGKRLAHDRFDLEKDDGLEISAIVPNQALDVMQRVLASTLIQDDTVALEISETHFTLHAEDTVITATQIEGMYPNYRTIFPGESKVRATARRGDLLSAARSAALTTDKQTSTVLLKIAPESLTVESNAQNIGESTIQVPLRLQGEPIDVRLNPVLLIEALRTFDEEDVNLEIASPDKPVTLRGARNYRHLIMPLVIK